MSEREEHADVIFRALAASSRRRILAILSAGPRADECCSSEEFCGCDLTSATGLSAATISHHMAMLVEAGLVSGEKRGNWVYYRLNPDAVALVMAELRALVPDDPSAIAVVSEATG